MPVHFVLREHDIAAHALANAFGATSISVDADGACAARFVPAVVDTEAPLTLANSPSVEDDIATVAVGSFADLRRRGRPRHDRAGGSRSGRRRPAAVHPTGGHRALDRDRPSLRRRDLSALPSRRRAHGGVRGTTRPHHRQAAHAGAGGLAPRHRQVARAIGNPQQARPAHAVRIGEDAAASRRRLLHADQAGRPDARRPRRGTPSPRAARRHRLPGRSCAAARSPKSCA